ncbi:hypothetical protein TSUD_280790 [Trifolium subterraneum]|uniref:Uncharacterized protein n=1 Tax=Trifolium subterraneum TaxID=3900 RepID=A0A2Z6P9V0_TRISU|nr:hypothetical protein TSUD_280790 [Trifolium subterraneum]
MNCSELGQGTDPNPLLLGSRGRPNNEIVEPLKQDNSWQQFLPSFKELSWYFKPSSPPRRVERSESPPARRPGTSQRRHVLERVQPPPQVQKQNRTPPREDVVARANKRGKAVALFKQRPRSPPRRKELLLGGMTHGSRGDDYQYRRENSPRREETHTHSPGWSDDEVYKGPLSRQIMDLELPRALQKPPQLGKYDGLTDPDTHVQNIDVILNYQAVKGGIKCRIFPATLVEGVMAWYRSLPQGSITSWKDLCKQFTSHFTASRKHLKTEENLEDVRQGPDETLRPYIERFNKEAVQVDVTDDMKKYLMRKNLRDGTKFKEMVAIEKPATWDEILYKAQAYMQFEEETMADAMRYSRTEDNHPPREQGNKNGDKRNGDRRGRYNSDFKNAGIRFPKSTPFKPDQDRSRYCAYHKSYGHLTDDCIQLKDAIEILIRNGKLKDYFKRKENPRQEKKREDTPEDEPKLSGEKKVAMAICKKKVREAHHCFLGHGCDHRKAEHIVTVSLLLSRGAPGGSANSQIPLLVKADMANFDVRRILVDSGSSCDIMYAQLFRTLQLDESHLTPYLGLDLQGFNGATTKPWGYVDLIVTFGHNETAKTAIADLPAVASTAHLKMKYYTNKEQVATLHGDIEAARRCFNAAYKGQSYIGPVPKAKKSKTSSEQAETSTKPPPQQPPQNKKDDAASKENLRPIPDGDFELIPLGVDPSRNLKIGKDVPDLARKQLVTCLKDNADMFAWSASEMPGLDPDIACHQLTIDEAANVVVQRRRMQSPGKIEAAEKVVKDLLEANFISESKYTTWLSNVVLVKKSNGKWRMCVDYTDLNRACPKDAYPLPCIDRLRMMNKVFRGEIGDMLEVYMDDMIVKSHEEVNHTIHLQKVFEQARKVNMRFNPKKCTFGIRAGKFHGFYLTERGIDANPNKFRAFTEFPTPNDKKSIQTLNGMLTALSQFIAKSAQHALPLFKLLRKESAFEYTGECEQAHQHLKMALSEPSVLSRPDVGEVLYLYLAIASEGVSATLIRETLEGQKPHTRSSLELSKFDIRYESRKALKAQILANFVAEMTCWPSSTDGANKRTIFVDGASNATGAGAGIILKNEKGILIEVSLALSFPTSNNQAKYEAFLAGVRLAEDVGAKEIKIYTDSQLVASQVLGEYQAKNDNLSEYLTLVKERITKFDSVEIQHVPREHNKRADILSKLASTKINNGNKSIIQEILSHPSIEKPTKVLGINAIEDTNCWMTPVYNYLAYGTLPNDEKEVATVKRRSRLHPPRDTRGKALRVGYYWPTIQQDAKEHVKKCDKCQRHADMHLAPPHELKSLSSPWPFAWWGMDILGPFTRGNLQCRYLIVGVDYFTKWVEAEPLLEITSFRILRFFKRDILCRFGIPQVVVTDNGTQFTDKTFHEFLAKINSKNHFTSVMHPQTNGQAEAVNRVILRGLRRRLGDAKKQWVEELPHVLWTYRTTPHSTTGETPFRLAYGTEAVIPVEIGEPSRRTEAPLVEEMNDEAMREELDLVEEIRTAASLKEASLK